MKQKLIRQHNAITKARYEMSALEKNILYMLLAQLREEDLPSKIYRIEITELQKITGRDVDHIQFSRTTKKLVGRLLHTHYDEDKELSLNILSSGEYKRNSGAIELELSQEIRMFLFALKNNFTQFGFAIALSLKSKYSKRIYEMICQYKDTGILRISITELKARLCLTDTKTKKDKYPKYGLLRAKVLDVAQKELDAKSDVTFTYEAVKTGKKYTHLTFTIRRKGTHPPKDPLVHVLNDKDTTEKESLTKKLIQKYKLSPWQAHRIVEEVSSEEIGKTTYTIQLEVINHKVHNIGGYTAKVFDKKYNLGLFQKR